jgi:hypothetical protein
MPAWNRTRPSLRADGVLKSKLFYRSRMHAAGTGSITVLFSTRQLPGDQREPGRSAAPQHEVGAPAKRGGSEGRRSAEVRLPRNPGSAMCTAAYDLVAFIS